VLLQFELFLLELDISVEVLSRIDNQVEHYGAVLYIRATEKENSEFCVNLLACVIKS